MIQQPAPQSALQQVQPHQRIDGRAFATAVSSCPPPCLDLAKPFHNHFIVMAVRSPMHRQDRAERGALCRGEEQAVAPEIVKAQPILPDPPKQGL